MQLFPESAKDFCRVQRNLMGRQGLFVVRFRGCFLI